TDTPALHCFPTRRSSDLLDESAFVELLGAIERLTEHFASQQSVPKELALAFVDITNSFTFNEGAYSEQVRNRIEDAGHELSFLRSEEHTSELQSRENLVC